MSCQRPDARRAAYECLATALFVWATASSAYDQNVVLATAAASGAMAAALSHSLGAAFNPVLTLARAATGRLTAPQAAVDVFAQLAGALAGAAVLRLGPGMGALGGNAVVSGVSWSDALLGEAVASFAVVLLVLHSEVPAAVYGASVFAGTVVLLPYSSAGMNPLRTLGPAVVSRTWGAGLWTLVVGPAVGGGLAAAATLLLQHRWTDDKAPAEPETLDRAWETYRAATGREAI